MGLDVYAYVFGAQVGSSPNYDDYEERFNWESTVYTGPDDLDFPKHAEGVPPFAVFEVAERIHFRAGSYGHYNWWREQISQAVLGVMPNLVWSHPEQYDSPFVWLIHFTDCDGIIGPVKAKLLADAMLAERAKVEGWVNANMNDFEWPYSPVEIRGGIMDKYDHFQRAFAMAARGGMVKFA